MYTYMYGMYVRIFGCMYICTYVWYADTCIHLHYADIYLCTIYGNC